MKKIFTLFLLFTFASCSGTNITVREFAPDHILHYSQCRELGEDVSLSDYVCYLNKGDTIPLEMTLDTHLLGIEKKVIDLTVREKLYFRFTMAENLSKEDRVLLENFSAQKLAEMSEAEKQAFFQKFMLFVSADSMNWAPVTDFSSVKKVLGMKGGTISFGMGMSKEEGVNSYLHIEEIR